MINDTKGQFIAILSVMIIGIISYTTFNIAAKNLQDTLDHYYIENNFQNINVQLLKIPSNVVQGIKSKYDYDMVSGRIVFDVPFISDNKDEKVTARIISQSSNDNVVNKLHINEGRFITNKNKDALIISKFAEARNIKIGDKIKVQISGKQYSLNVAGLVDSPEYIYIMENEQSLLPMPDKFGIIYISDELARQSFGFGNSYNEVLIKINKNQTEEKEEERLKDTLDDYGVKRVIIRENQLSNSMISEELEQLAKMSNSVPMMFLIVAVIIIMMMVSRMVKKDKTIIGIMKALGYTNREVLMHYSKYALSIGVLSGILGTILGMILSKYMTLMYMMYYTMPALKVTIYYEYVAYGIVLSSLLCLFAAFLGAREVLKINPAESMKPDSPKTGKKIFLENIKIIWNNISFNSRLTIKNIFRNKKRLIFIVVGIAFTYSLMLVTNFMNIYFADLFYDHYGKFQKMDYSINFSKPMNKLQVKELNHLIEIDYMEPKIEFPFELIHEKNKKVVNVIGVESDTKFYTFTNVDNEIIDYLDDGIYLSKNLAQSLNVKVGDKVKIHSFIPDRKDTYLRVRGIIKQSLGINAYINIKVMSDKLLDKELVTGVYINSKDNVNKKLNNVANIAVVQSQQDLIDIFEQFMGMTIFSIGIMVFFSGLLGFSIVYNVSVISIGERERELATMRVLGYTKNEISNFIVKENIIMTILGIILGIPLGIIMITGMAESFATDIYSMEPEIDPMVYVYATIYTILFVIIGQWSMYRKIRKLQLLEALKMRE